MSSLSKSDALASPAEEHTQPMSSRANAQAAIGPLDATLAPPMRIRFPDPPTSALSLDGLPGGPATTPAPRSALQLRLPQVPGYEVLGELGRGGMGVVYRARQVRLNRFVALKMLLEADQADLSDVVRFRSEAEAVAAVRHPHVVQVHEFGHFEGKPYFAMEFLPGGTLHNRIRTVAALEPRGAAELVEKLARAVQAAHAQGIVHRDLKPGNVLFDESGEPRITDFGLAKRVSLQLTQTQAVMGTPAYMSPEQAVGRAKFVGPPTDIYALGVILYECLTGHPPFAGDDSISVIHQVLNDTPRSIRSQVPDVPRDLDLICLKCLEKEPHDRYATSAALAEDLGRYLAGEPVLVRPAGPIERGIKWARRRPTMATVYALALLVFLVTSIGLGMFGLWRQAVYARDQADLHSQVAGAAKADADQQRHEAELARDDLKDRNGELELARQALEAKNRQVETALGGERSAKVEAQNSAKTARDATAKAEEAKEKLEMVSYLRNVAFANLESRQGNILRARQMLENCPESRRNWEWWHAYRAAHEDAASGTTNAIANDIAFTGTDINVTTADETGVITPFDIKKGEGIPRALAGDAPCSFISRLSSDASRLLTVQRCPKKGELVATVWETKSGNSLKTFDATGEGASSAAISGNGERILIGFQAPAHLIVFDVPTGKPLATLEGYFHTETIALNRDGSRAMATRRTKKAEYEVVVWDTVGGEVLASHISKFGMANALALDAEGTVAAIGFSNGALALLDVRTQKVIETEKAHTGSLWAVAVSPDGKKVASSGDDGIVRICHPQTGALEQLLRGHTKRVLSLKFDASGRNVASTDIAQRFFVWDLRGTKQAIVKLEPPAQMKGPFVADKAGYRCFSFGTTGPGQFWDAKNGKIHTVNPPPGANFIQFAFDPKGNRFAAADDRGTVHLWDSPGTVATDLPPLEPTKFYRELGEGAGIKVSIETLCFSDDGARLLVADGWQVAVFDAKTREKVFAHDVRHALASISEDGRRVAASWYNLTTVWNLDSKKSRDYTTRGIDWVSSLAFNPKGDTFAAGTRDWGLYLFDLSDAEGIAPIAPRAKLEGHSASIRSLGFHPHGHRLVSGADDGAIKVWDTATGQESISINIFVREPIRSILFSNGGNDIIATPDKYPPFVLHGGVRPLVVPPRR